MVGPGDLASADDDQSTGQHDRRVNEAEAPQPDTRQPIQRDDLLGRFGWFQVGLSTRPSIDPSGAAGLCGGRDAFAEVGGHGRWRTMPADVGAAAGWVGLGELVWLLMWSVGASSTGLVVGWGLAAPAGFVAFCVAC
jgi:hypothetical protein